MRFWPGTSKLLKQSQMEGNCKVLGATPKGHHRAGGGGVGSTRLTTDLKRPNLKDLIRIYHEFHKKVYITHK